jgi:hypothetical protein
MPKIRLEEFAHGGEMDRNRIIILLVLGVAVLSLQVTALFGQDSQADHGKPEPPLAGIHWAKGEQPAKVNNSSSSSPNLIWYGGPIMPTAYVKPIFWGPSWGNASFVGDKQSGLQTFYMGIGGSGYAQTADEYKDATHAVSDAITYVSSVTDLSQAQSGNRTLPILNEVCKQYPKPDPNGYFPVYVDLPRGHAGYCAWHSAGSCGGVPVQFAFFFNLDGDAGCDPQDTSNIHSQGLAALANVSGHELSEARTDPRLNAWMDSSGSENADKCAWAFGTSLLSFTNNSQWKIQGNWSNTAYNTTRAYPNLSGQKGCIDGGMYK